MWSLLFSLQKLSDADKLYSSSAAAYMSELSDPRLCHTSALRLGTPTPDNKNGKREDKSDSGDKLIPVKEEEGVEGGMQGSSDDYGGWCDTGGVTTVLHGDLHDPGLFMAGQATHSPDTQGGQDHSRGHSPGGAGGGGGAVTVCSVFSLSECEVTPGPPVPVSSVSSVSVPALPVTEVRLSLAARRQHRHLQQPPHHRTLSKCR